MLEYRILGPLQVARDGVEVVLSAPKVRAVALVLLLYPNEVVSADLLVDALWGDHPPDSARKLIQVYVSQLRSALGAKEIETVAQGYRITVAPMGLDATRFDRMRRDGREALATGNAELALALSRRALALWHGTALVDVAEEPYAAAEAARLNELRLECAEDELDAELALGRHAEAVPRLQRLSAEHPLRERLRERFALALYRCARQSEALEVLAAGRKLLLEELGLEPGKGHQDLEAAILNQDPGLDDILGGTASGPAQVPTPSSTLIGRQEELEHLRGMVLRDDVRIVTVSGAGGSGKTRVALELARTTGSAFANGSAFVELASIQDPSLVLASIAQTLGVPEVPEETRATTLSRWLQTRDLLLVVDNFEHVIEAAPELAGLVQHAPRLTMVVTSRRVLHLSGEHVFPVTPLPVDDAVRLFSERAAAHLRTAATEAQADDPAAIEAICRRLDCLPLAVELAAARSTTLTPSQLLERLSDRVGGLGVGPRDAPARQQTLTDTL
ncbi:MAG: AfsR/SARP family transcriptional regulator, partial [Geodermatophilaceae bacterium]|nr:AfsR/SARP family transcriptional regulator [Geodermatophilaceae bacterium]